MDRLSVTSANFESTAKDVLCLANFQEKAIFKFSTVGSDTGKIMHVYMLKLGIKRGKVALR